MKRKSLIAIAASLLVGIAIEFYKGEYKYQVDVPNKIAILLGGGTSIMLFVIVLPLIVSIIIFVIKNRFPNDTFTTMTYSMLVIIALGLIVAEWNIKTLS